MERLRLHAKALSQVEHPFDKELAISHVEGFLVILGCVRLCVFNKAK